ncbi:AMP-binding protein [Bacillus fonticola]|uniref:AMP-binding protein n=1 Tax=Bacillus fonticola TaxID=2728853 RepID=UPI001472DA8D|nr:AMP-binding protein [Bacillus fonticola]
MESVSETPWTRMYPQEIPTTLTYDVKPLPHYLEEVSNAYGDATAIHFLGYSMTFSKLYTEAKTLASYLQRNGIRKGDRVAIMLPNCPQAVVGYYGVLLAGGIVVQTNPLYTEQEVAYQLKDSGAKAIITLDILYPRVSKVKDTTSLEHIIVTEIKQYLPFPKNLLYPFVQKKQYGIQVKVEHKAPVHLWNVIQKQGPLPFECIDIDPQEDLALLQYTGGTTGYPKGVMLTHENLVANVKMCTAWMYRCERGKETVLGILPFFHVYGMTTVMLLSVMEAQKMVLLPKFDPETVLKTIQKERPTLFPGAPTIYIGLLNHPDLSKYDLSSVNACISGSAPLPVEVKEQFEKVTGGNLVEGYGLTESSPVTHSNFLWDGHGKRGSIGVPWPDTLAAIRSFEGESAPVGEVGEIVVKGPQVMKGYWNKEEETAEVLQDGWLSTGDLGYMDEDGYFYVVDRKKDMIIAGGYNVYPREIEEVLYEHEAVQEVVAAGVPDAYRGETVKAYVVLKEGKTISEKELDAFCRKSLAAYKVPRIYEFRAELPKTAVGKILRRKLVEEEREKQIAEEKKQA